MLWVSDLVLYFHFKLFVQNLINFHHAATWWWIAFRIHGVVKILRNRDNPEMAVQLYILITGLAVELVFLVWYFSIPLFPYFLKRWLWNHRLWYEHLPPLLAMLLSWVLVVVFGLWVELPNIFFPCSGSTSMICRALITWRRCTRPGRPGRFLYVV